jgi:drug/metabolite transporter (DMT)-like permease
METPSVDKIISAAVPILYCGIISGGVGYTLQIVAQRFTDPTVASLLMSLESVFAVIAGAVFLNEQMSVRELIGCAVMFAAIILVQIPIKQKQKSNKQNNTQA